MFKLHKGNCLEVMQEIPTGSVDMILCDLPYGTTACKWDTVIPFEPLWEQYKRVIKKNGAILLFGAQPFTSVLGVSNIVWLKYNWCWIKSRASGHLNAKKMPMNNIEDILVFYNSPPTYNPQITEGAPYKIHRKTKGSQLYGTQKDTYSNNDGSRQPLRTIYTKSGSNSHDKPVHPTQKPVALCEYLIKTYTKEGEWVLDNTMGSGTTGVACVNTNRNFIGIEQDEKYFAIAEKRIGDANT